MMNEAYRIFIATSQEADLTALGRVLTQAGHEQRGCRPSAEALTAVQEYAPDLILMDLPCGQDGSAELYAALRECEDTASIPVLFVTEAGAPERVAQVYASGASDYVSKPFIEQEVLARVDTQIRVRRTERQLTERKQQFDELNGKFSVLSRRDPLTNLLNRSAWEEKAIRQHEMMERYDRPYSIIMVDIDHFRIYNESQGRQAGDQCLCRIADAVEGACRRVDYVGRYGEEVFAVLAPETDGDKALKLADRIHRAIWALGIPHSSGGVAARITASLGVVVSSPGCWEDVLRRAESAVLVAKRAGRNMVYAETEPITPAGAASACAAQPEEPIEVLVVDDDPTNRAVCKGCLQRAGYKVREAEDGRVALAQVKEKPPDVIIMDVMMPNMDGLECTRALRADPDSRDIPIIIVSALSRTEDLLAGLQAGADEYISKPIRSSELTLRVQSMVRLHRERLDLLRSYEQRGKQMRILTRLVAFCREVSLCKSAADILEQTVQAVADVMDCRRVSIMLPDQTEQSLEIASSLGLDGKLARTLKVKLGESIAGQVFTSGQPVIVNSQAEVMPRSRDYQAPYFASIPLACAPLDAAGRVVGVLNLTEKRDGLPFESRDLEYIELISKVTGTALHDLNMREARDQASDSIMVALASLAECRDNDTGRHLDRVTRFCMILAERLRQTDQYCQEIDDEFLYNLERAVPLHDIGKVGIPDEILLFPGRLSEEQMSIMRTHSEVGAATIESLMSRAPGVCFLEMARDIARHHHERYDGTGYPDRLHGKSTPLSARITAVADVYDALTTRRVYKEPYSHDRAVAIIVDGSGTAFDPDIVEAFMQREQLFAALAEALADPLETANNPREQVLSGAS